MTIPLTQILVILMTSYSVTSVPCTFHNVGEETRAFCSARRLTRLPVTWPVPRVTWLDISQNMLTSLGGLADPHLTHLRYLDLRNNGLKQVSSDHLQYTRQLEHLDVGGNPLVTLLEGAFKAVPHLTSLALRESSLNQIHDQALRNLSGLVTLDLHSNQLHTVPVAALKDLQTLQSLDLSSNGIADIANDSFSSFINLVSLNLAGNALSRLTLDAFRGLSKLKFLDLSYNSLAMTNVAYAPGVFSRVPALETLRLHNNDNSDDRPYPLNVFYPLRALKVFSIDVFQHSHFGEAFSSLTNVTHLLLTDSCRLASVTNTTFSAFKNSSLELLALDCSIGRIELCAFCHFPKLQTLRLTANSHLQLDVALRAMYGLQNQSLKVIDLSHNKYQVNTAVLNQENTKYLANVCVERLELSECLVSGFSTMSFNKFQSPLVDCLRHLDISSNLLTNWLLDRLILRLFLRLKRLEVLMAQNQQTRSITTDVCTLQPTLCQESHRGVVINSFTVNPPLPPHLRVINLSGFVDHITHINKVVHFTRADNLTTIDLSYNGLTSCKMEVTGLKALRDLNLRGNSCKQMSPKFLYQTPELRRLDMANLNLDPAFLLAQGKALLSKLPLLEELDLSFNALSLLQRDLLTGKPRLRKLSFANNRFQHIPVDVLDLHDLTELDMTSNVMASLSSGERRIMDTLASTRPSFTLRLRGNPFSCTCANMGFVRWLAVTSVRLDGDIRSSGFDEDYDDNGRAFPCWLEDGSLSDTVTVFADRLVYWRQCNGQYLLWIASSLLSLQLVGLLVTFIICRNWTHILYVVHALRNYRMPQRSDFRKDAYLGYADADEELALEVYQSLQLRHGVDLLLRFQEELPGSVRAENVVENIDESWKVLLMVTEATESDEWSAFTIMQAQRSICDKMPDRVIVIFRDHLLLQHMPSLEALLRMVPERNVFHIPRDAPPTHRAWIHIARLVLDPPTRS